MGTGAFGYPEGPVHKPVGRIRHLVGAATTPAGPSLGRVALERNAGQRRARLTAAVTARRRTPTMRALVASTGGRLRWRDVPAPPSPGPDAALVHPIAVASCDLDRAMGLGRTPFVLPLQFGHECVAEVVEIGENVTSVRPGDQVVVPFQISCGRCAPCSRGLTGNCAAVPPISMYGFGVTGGHWGGVLADLVSVPFADGMLVPLPAEVDPAAAASVADNVADGYRLVAPHLPAILAADPDAPVLVLAELGRRMPLSASAPLYAALVARALGARQVHFVDRRPHLRRHADALGLHAHRPEDVPSLPLAPLVVDGTVTAPGLATAISRTAPDGTCAAIASMRRTTKIPTALMYGRNISFHLGRSHARAQIPAVLELMATGALDTTAVTTHLGSLDAADRVFGEHLRGDATKTIVVEQRSPAR
ncbi:zinc-dependent alcohol dehydrogenase [Saccharopolyspora flava]|uniref:Alcohol dehydrogenase n=1 Tax=Saccharopolyspora flava TaxID=95161 RepID=A0A1I6UCU3_9PSEU|nr:alcohol dehydrogenase catalytic domain-containing protein [Saccharopolyspora flava]SFS99252.1 alcohol dehydrogenase [Saccharopolyspora flava]